MKILVKDGIIKKCPYTITDLIRDNRHISWPAVVSKDLAESHGCCDVVDVDQPRYDPATQTCTMAPPVREGGQWVQQWAVTEKTVEQIDAEQLAIAIALRNEIRDAIQALLDAECQRRDYDSINTACGWAGVLDDATALRAWGASCWAKATIIEQEVLAGTRSLPTVAEVMAEMPVFTL